MNKNRYEWRKVCDPQPIKPVPHDGTPPTNEPVPVRDAVVEVETGRELHPHEIADLLNRAMRRPMVASVERENLGNGGQRFRMNLVIGLQTLGTQAVLDARELVYLGQRRDVPKVLAREFTRNISQLIGETINRDLKRFIHD